jgi:hypothetical protein
MLARNGSPGLDLYGQAARGLCLVLFLLALVGLPIRAAFAVPAFAVQTGQPCAVCHVGAFGPQLKKYGRDFKMFGFTASDGKAHFPPLAVTGWTSFNNTAKDEPGNIPHVGPNDNFAFDQISIYYAGRITSTTGAFSQFTYSGVDRDFHWDNQDFRWIHDGELFDEDFLVGLTANNNPTVTDVWNSTPAWGFPYNASAIAAGPAAAAQIDGALGGAVAGLGAYASWNDWVYLEIDGYKGLGRDVRNAFGATPVTGTDSVDGISPYWRAAIEHDFAEGEHSFEIGTYGLRTSVFPAGIKIGRSDDFTDAALDANYQWIANPKSVTSSVISAHATGIWEDQNLAASQALFGTNAHDWLREWRADVSYSYDATWTPTIQRFDVHGSTDAARFGSPNGADTNGWIAELAFVPWGKPDSPVNWANARLALQYVAYDRFNGSTSHAGDANTIFLNLWLAFSPNP